MEHCWEIRDEAYRYAWMRELQHDDCEDFASEVLYRAMRYGARSPKYLADIRRHAFIDLWRDKTKYRRGLQAELDRRKGANGVWRDQQDAMDLAICLEDVLGWEMMRAFALISHGHSIRDAADALGISYNTLYSRIQSTRKHLDDRDEEMRDAVGRLVE